MSDVKMKFNESAMKELEGKALEFLNKIADDVLYRSQQLVPVNTGSLQESLDVFDSESKWEKLIGSKTIEYAIYQEMGTVKMPPHAYLRPALDEVVGQL